MLLIACALYLLSITNSASNCIAISSVKFKGGVECFDSIVKGGTMDLASTPITIVKSKHYNHFAFNLCNIMMVENVVYQGVKNPLISFGCSRLGTKLALNLDYNISSWCGVKKYGLADGEVKTAGVDSLNLFGNQIVRGIKILPATYICVSCLIFYQLSAVVVDEQLGLTWGPSNLKKSYNLVSRHNHTSANLSYRTGVRGPDCRVSLRIMRIRVEL